LSYQLGKRLLTGKYPHTLVPKLQPVFLIELLCLFSLRRRNEQFIVNWASSLSPTLRSQLDQSLCPDRRPGETLRFKVHLTRALDAYTIPPKSPFQGIASSSGARLSGSGLGALTALRTCGGSLTVLRGIKSIFQIVQNPWAPKIESLSPVMTRGLAIST
jgi:hypothetical protein